MLLAVRSLRCRTNCHLGQYDRLLNRYQSSLHDFSGSRVYTTRRAPYKSCLQSRPRSSGAEVPSRPGITSFSTNGARLVDGDSANRAETLLQWIPSVNLEGVESMPTSLSILKAENHATFDSLIRFVRPLASVHAPDEPLVVVLATRSFASELRSRSDLIRQVASQVLSEQLSTLGSFQTLLAIVDKLPSSLVETEVDADQTQQTQSSGTEGICVAISSSRFSGVSSESIDNWSPESSRFTHSLGPESPATLTCFLTPSHKDALHSLNQQQSDIGGRTSPGPRTFSVQLPLPSTVFENGLKNTLVLSKYERDGTASNFFERSSENVRHAQIALPYASALAALDSILTLPLESLTAAAQVVDCKGNIVRQVRPLQDPNGKVKPASEGLEHAVSKYFTDRGIPPHTLAIWALITPREMLEPTSRIDERTREQFSHMCLNPSAPVETMDSGLTNDLESPLLNKLLQAGAKLRRVTSGGGGWGNKAGLLSLDPETSFSIITNPLDLNDLVEGGDADWLGSGLEPIARPTDLIQFFYTSEELVDKVRPPEAADKLEPFPNSTIFTFGVVPSTIDDMEFHGQPIEAGLSFREPKVIINRFGALSEKGLSLRLRSINYREGSPLVEENETKVDVPFASLHLPNLEAAPTKPTGNTLGFTPTEPRRAVTSIYTTTNSAPQTTYPSAASRPSEAFTVRYSNRLPSLDEVSTSSHRRNVPLPFRPDHAATRKKAQILSSHPRVRERVLFVTPETNIIQNVNPGDRERNTNDASLTAEAFFWAARKRTGRLVGSDDTPAAKSEVHGRWDELVSEVEALETRIAMDVDEVPADEMETVLAGRRWEGKGGRKKPLTATVKAFLKSR